MSSKDLNFKFKAAIDCEKFFVALSMADAFFSRRLQFCSTVSINISDIVATPHSLSEARVHADRSIYKHREAKQSFRFRTMRDAGVTSRSVIVGF